MAYSIDPIQDNCYPGTTVLVNKLHIHDEAALQEAEALATYVNASKLEQCPLEGVFDFAHYKAIHQFLFSDLYDWAGQIRMVNISKKGTDFCPAGEIEPQAKLIFDRLKEQDYFKGLPHDTFVEEITDFAIRSACASSVAPSTVQVIICLAPSPSAAIRRAISTHKARSASRKAS